MKTYKAPKSTPVNLNEELLLGDSYNPDDVTYSKGINGRIIDDDEEE